MAIVVRVLSRRRFRSITITATPETKRRQQHKLAALGDELNLAAWLSVSWQRLQWPRARFTKSGALIGPMMSELGGIFHQLGTTLAIGGHWRRGSLDSSRSGSYCKKYQLKVGLWRHLMVNNQKSRRSAIFCLKTSDSRWIEMITAGVLMCGQDAFLCSICFQPIKLNQCKIDEDGRPVHERCYALRLLNAPPEKNTHHEEGWRGFGWRFTRIVGKK
jgi:hypothetical protein